MVSFVRFVLSFANDPSAHGDVARDVKDDEQVQKEWGYRELKRHIVEMGATPAVFDLLDEMHVMHKFSKIANLGSSSSSPTHPR